MTGAHPAPAPAQASAADSIGLPFYPGATPLAPGPDDTGTAQALGMQVAKMETTDPTETVVAFYRDRFPAGSRHRAGASRLVRWVTETRGGVRTTRMSLYDSADSDRVRTVEIVPDGAKTRITLTAISGLHMPAPLSDKPEQATPGASTDPSSALPPHP